ncbi:hypothetical protein B0H19DRAFT_1251863 [Mycena capillaripes]|nr:hypothetical protein B0H19DRAFT_1251863 [Mycena capillaripes]
MSCIICLSQLKEPVSVPCGHVYCKECLTAHVCATSPDGFTSTCPSCRDTFNMVRPELTCLPKTFHQYIVPSIRRVYIDMPHENLRKKLSASEARVKTLEKDKERLMGECERHIAAAHAHGRGETTALRKAQDLQGELQMTQHNAAHEVAEAQAALFAMKVKYDKMKRLCRSYALEAAHREEEDAEAEANGPSHKRNSSVVDLCLDETVSPKRLRVIRPLPRSRQCLQTPVNQLRGSQLHMPGGLGSPFHS